MSNMAGSNPTLGMDAGRMERGIGEGQELVEEIIHPFSKEQHFCSHVPGEPWTHSEGSRVCTFQRGKSSSWGRVVLLL